MTLQSILCRVAFDEDRVPNLYDDQHVLQDIHSVPSLLKMYFRELPNPICTYHLYDKFVEAAKSTDDQRLGKNQANNNSVHCGIIIITLISTRMTSTV